MCERVCVRESWCKSVCVRECVSERVCVSVSVRECVCVRESVCVRECVCEKNVRYINVYLLKLTFFIIYMDEFNRCPCILTG